MKAGRELDAIVAEKVMGWTRHETHPIPRRPGDSLIDAKLSAVSAQYLPHSYSEPDDRPWWVRSGERPQDATLELPEFSTDIAAAWEVVEKFRADPANHMIDVFWDLDLWYCHIHSRDNKPRHVLGEETAPLAICLAALKAVGHPIPD